MTPGLLPGALVSIHGARLDLLSLKRSPVLAFDLVPLAAITLVALPPVVAPAALAQCEAMQVRTSFNAGCRLFSIENAVLTFCLFFESVALISYLYNKKYVLSFFKKISNFVCRLTGGRCTWAPLSHFCSALRLPRLPCRSPPLISC
jgi:hypothetical protein